MEILSEKKLQSGNLYRLRFDNAPDSFIAVDEAGIIVIWDEQAKRNFGWHAEEILGTPLSQTLIPSRLSQINFDGKISLLMQDAAAPARQLDVRVCHKNGTEIPVTLAVIPIQAAQTTQTVGLSETLPHASKCDAVFAGPGNIGIADSVLSNLPDAVVIADVSGKLVTVNQAAQRLLGLYDVNADPDQNIHSFNLLQENGMSYPEGHNPVTGALQGKTVENLEGLARSKNLKRDIWVNFSAKPIHGTDGRLSGTMLVLQDITKWRQREEETRQDLAILQKQASLLDLTRDAIIVRSAQTDIITYWNTGAERLYQFKKEEAIGQISHELLRTRFPLPYEQIQSMVAETGFWEGEVIQKDRSGHEIIVHSQWAVEAYEGQPQRYLETNTDITQRVQAERALEQSQENYRLLVEASTEYAIIMLDPNGMIISWNPGAEKVLKLTEKEALGKPISAMFTMEDGDKEKQVRELEEALATGRSGNDCWHIRRDGSRFWATGVVTPLWNQDGSLRGYVKIMRDETEQRVEEEGTQFLAHHDALTGLHNRVSFSNELHKAIARADRTKIPFAVLLLDLDRFKNVNDALGHHAGDLLLKEVALRIQSSIRETDFVARLGGDEFVVIQSDISEPDAGRTLAGKLVNELGKPYVFENMEIVSGASIGIAIYPKHAANSVELLKRADLAMYRAKHAGRHNYQFYSSDLLLEADWKKGRAQALRKALQNHKFELYYQPQVDLDNWKITAVEALLRWHATELDLVLPNEFLAVAEETGIIVEIGEWALRQACLQVRQWQTQGLSDLRISLNCSARQFSDAEFVAMIPSILDDVGLAHSFLELEISESMLALQPEIKEQLIELRASGVRITIDNFGTGNIALLDLKDLALDALKIDKEFVRHLPHRRQDSAITSAIISLAHDLGVDVIAGGVETAEQLAYLKAQHCASAQGFIFSPPLSSEKFTELISGDGWFGLNRVLNQNPLEGSQNLH